MPSFREMSEIGRCCFDDKSDAEAVEQVAGCE